MKLFLILFIFFLPVTKVKSQVNICADTVTYYTMDMGDGQTNILFPLEFKIVKDSIFLITSTANNKFIFVSFKIEESICNWNFDFSKGTSLYKVITNNSGLIKKAVVNVTRKNNNGRIQLIYENSEPRIFTLQ